MKKHLTKTILRSLVPLIALFGLTAYASLSERSAAKQIPGTLHGGNASMGVAGGVNGIVTGAASVSSQPILPAAAQSHRAILANSISPQLHPTPTGRPTQPAPAQTVALAVVQPSATAATAIPVTGAASTVNGGPWILLIGMVGLVAVLLVLFTRNRMESSPSLSAGPSLASLSGKQSAAASTPSSPEGLPSMVATKPDPLRYEYEKTTQTIPPSEAPPIYDRSYTITAVVDRPATDSNGVLFVVGSAQDGYGMYLLNGRLCYQQSTDSIPHQLISIIPVQLGRCTLQFRFLRTAPYQGTGSLYIDGRMVNTTFFDKTLAQPPTEGLNVGYDGGSPLSRDYIPPYPFMGVLHQVVFEIEVP